MHRIKILSFIYIILIIVFFAGVALPQQPLQFGFVRDASSQEPIIGAVVQSNYHHSLTNEFGYFSIQVEPIQDTLFISHVGYQSQTRVIHQQTDSLVTILMEVNQFGEIHVVYDQKFKTRKNQRIGSMVIGADDLSEMPMLAGETDIIKYLSMQSGVASGIETYSQISVRGGGLFENHFYLDGIPVYNTGHFLGLTSIFNGNIIRQAEFYTGAAPAEYGGRLSSVTAIETKKGNKKQWAFNGDFGILDSDISIEGPISDKGPSSVIASSRAFYIFPLVNELQKNTEGANFYFYDLNLKANYEISPGSKLELSYFYGQDKLRYNDISRNSTGEMTNHTEDQDVSNSVVSLRYFNAIQKKYFLSAIAGYTDNRGGFNNSNELSYSSYNERNQQAFSAQLRDFYSKVKLDILLPDNWRWTNGIESLYHNINPGRLSEHYFTQSGDISQESTHMTTNPTLRMMESSIFSSLDGYISKHMRIQPGLRISSGISSRHFIRLEPRLSVQYERPAATFKFNVGSTNQYLHPIIFGNSEIQPMIVWLPVNKDRKPQRSDQISIGVSTPFWNNRMMMNTEIYYKNYRELLTLRQVVDNFDLFIHTEKYLAYGGTGTSYGIEWSGEGHFNKLKINLFYNWMRSFRQFDEINNGREYPFKFQREHSFGLNAHYRLSDQLQMSGAFVLNSGHRYTYPLGYVDQSLLTDQYFIFNDRNNVNLPAYHRADLGIVWNKVIKEDHVFGVKFGIYNLYGRKNAVSVFPDWVDDETSEFQVKGIVILRFLPYINVTLNRKL